MADEDKARADQAAASEAGPFTVKLRRPITTDEGEVKELKINEPTVADIESNGMPCILDWSTGKLIVHFDERRMTTMLAQLAGVTPGTIRKMHPKDWNTAAWGVAGFFVPDLTILS